MKIIVDLEACQQHGQCVYVAPELFWFEGNDLKYVPDPDDARRDLALEAEDSCPEQAIRLTEDEG